MIISNIQIMKKTSLLVVYLTVLSLAVVIPAMAQTNDSDIQSDPGILPTNPFYFIKNWSRSIRQTLTFDPVSKAKLELQVANEKIAEAKKVQKIDPSNTQKIIDAIQNYKDTQENLKERLQDLSNNTNSAEVNSLISDIVNQSIKHEKVLDEMAQTTENSTNIQNAVESAKEVINNNLSEASLKNSSDKFTNTLENALNQSDNGELGNIKSLEIMDRVIEKASESAKPALKIVRENMTQKLGDNIKNIYENGGTDSLKKAFLKLPYSEAKTVMIFKKIKPDLGSKVGKILDSTIKEMPMPVKNSTSVQEIPLEAPPQQPILMQINNEQPTINREGETANPYKN
jgi:hypothetical protein